MADYGKIFKSSFELLSAQYFWSGKVPACRFILDQCFTCWPIPNAWEYSKFSIAKMKSQITPIKWWKWSVCSFPPFPSITGVPHLGSGLHDQVHSQGQLRPGPALELVSFPRIASEVKTLQWLYAKSVQVPQDWHWAQINKTLLETNRPPVTAFQIFALCSPEVPDHWCITVARLLWCQLGSQWDILRSVFVSKTALLMLPEMKQVCIV